MCYIILILLCVMFLLELIQTEVHHVRTLKIMQKVSMSFRLLSCDVFVSYGCRQQGLFDTCVLLLLIISVTQFCYFLYYSFLCFGKRKYMFCLQRAGYPRDDLSLTIHSIGVEGVKLTANTDFYLFRFFTRECWIPWICHRILSIRYCQGLTIYYK